MELFEILKFSIIKMKYTAATEQQCNVKKGRNTVGEKLDGKYQIVSTGLTHKRSAGMYSFGITLPFIVHKLPFH